MLEWRSRGTLRLFCEQGVLMQLDWMLLGKALCLVAVIEGLVLAVAPQRMRKVAVMALQLDDRALRTLGLISMLIGAAFLLLLA